MTDIIKNVTEKIPFVKYMDWIMLVSASVLVIFGLITMNSFVEQNYFFGRQIIWFIFSLGVFFLTSLIDWSFLKRTQVLMILFAGLVGLFLFMLFAIGAVKGAQSWLDFGFFALQPTDFAKVLLILILAKYFSRRHIEIANIRHVFVSGIYAFILFLLVALQPDFGGALIIALIWLGMVSVSGISKKHLLLLFSLAIVVFVFLWNFGFETYQKNRIISFIHPMADIQDTGYNAYQSTVAVGSGQLLGKGIGYGTQSKLKFLPEYQTDFIFAAFAEEWGFLGVIIFLLIFGILMWRIIDTAIHGQSNFEILYGLGLAIFFMGHLFINVGANIGILPITGITLPFVSYGGSHLITSFFALGILVSTRRYMRSVHREEMRNEFLGI